MLSCFLFFILNFSILNYNLTRLNRKYTMLKIILKYIIFLLLIQFISPINFIGQIFAATTTLTYTQTASDIWWSSFIWSNVSDATWNTPWIWAINTITTQDAFTNYISLTNFDLLWAWLPSGSIINGIQVNVETDVSGRWIEDTTVWLTIDWTTIIWDNYWNGVNIDRGIQDSLYWWLTDLWWRIWTDSELLSSSFWVIIQYQNTNVRDRTVSIDRVSITVDYTPNNIPTDIILSNQSIPSALPIWSLVWDITTTDIDILDVHTYSFACSVPWIDDSSFSILGSELKSNEVFDDSVKSSYDICIRTDDWRTGIFDKNFTITITWAVPNNVPTDITLLSSDILESLPVWSLVWIIDTIDIDLWDVHTYSLACNIPWIDDNSFIIFNSNLNSNEVFSQSIKSSYNICIKTDDWRWWILDKNFTINILVNPHIWYAWLSTDIWGWNFIWNNPSNAELNTTLTLASSTISTRNDFTNYLSLTDFNLSAAWLPTNVRIDGIQVDVERNVSDTNMKDTTVQLTKNWTTLVWNNNWNNANWPTAKTITTYGSAADLWGTTWTASDLLSQDFWVILQYQYTRNWTEDVNVYRVKITVNYTILNNPGGVSWGLQFWLKADSWTDTITSGNALNTWSDQSINWFDATSGVAPTYLNDITNNINFNPYVDFNGTDQYMENLANWAYTQSYFAVIIPDQEVNWSLSGQVPFGFDCDSWVLNTWTCGLTFAWLTLWAFTAAINDEVITHAIWSSTGWRSAEIWTTSYGANKPMLINMNENSTWDGTEISEKGLVLDNYNVNTYQTLSTADYRLWMSTDPNNPFEYNWKIAEIINYNSRITPTDKQKIESYLSLKYWMTLDSGTKDYILSDWVTKIWDSILAWAYINDIFGIARDDESGLWQVKSQSVNNDNIITIEAVSEWTNSSTSFVDIDDFEWLTIANNDLWNTWTQTDTPSGYYNLSRIWRVQETWEVWTINIDFDVDNLLYDVPVLSLWVDYYFTYDSNDDGLFSDETPIAMINTSGSVWQIAGINLNNWIEFTISTQASSNNIPTDITLSNNIIDENVVVWTSIWILTSTDLDIADIHTYSLVIGSWDADNSLFSISWDSLNINSLPDFEINNSYTVRVQTDDWNLGQFQKEFIINISNLWETINSIIDFENIEDENKYSLTSWIWTRTITDPQEWIYSLESQNNWVANTQACFQIDNTFTDTWTVEFQYKVSSQAGWDFLKFYIDNIEQQTWSWEVAYTLYSDNTIIAGTHTYKWCYVKDWATDTWSDKSWIDYITFNDSPSDITAPIISSSNILADSILPWWNHSIEFNYSDEGGWSWIDTLSASLVLEKWNWSSWIVDTNISQTSITTILAIYDTSNLIFWKYRTTFNISDIALNTSIDFVTIFYIDEPDMVISTGSTDIWTLNSISNTFAPDIIITVKTIWSPFRVLLKKNTVLTSWALDTINYFDWTNWSGYDKNNDWSLFDYNDDVIWQELLNINTNWDLNTYVYIVKMWAIIDSLQSAWNYQWKINFGLELDY